jgi:hypothetical protein
MPIEKTCECCGKAFAVRPAKGGQRFCSKECQVTQRAAAHQNKTCEQCGSVFLITRKRELGRRFCTKACVAAYEHTHGREAARGPRAESTTFTCKQCGAPYTYTAGYLAEYRRKYDKDPPYCSRECANLGRRADGDAKHTVPCKNCGTLFTRSRRRSAGNIYAQQQLCSRQCKNEWVSKVYRAKHGLATITKRIKRGYVVLRIPASDGVPMREVFEHRHVMEQFLGRPLRSDETVHHKRAWDKTCNDLTNLELRTGNHGPGGAVEDLVPWCVEMLSTYPQFITPELLTVLSRIIEAKRGHSD